MWNREPALIVALVGALIGLLVSFGLELSAVQIAAVMTFITAAVGVVTRSQVTPSGAP